MPTPRKPDNVLDISGARKRNKKRYANRGAHATDSRAIGRAPAHLDANQKAAWRELVNSAAPGVLKKSDRLSIEVAARVLAEIRNGETQAAKVALLTSILHKCGMTPQGRNHVEVETPKPEKKSRGKKAPGTKARARRSTETTTKGKGRAR